MQESSDAAALQTANICRQLKKWVKIDMVAFCDIIPERAEKAREEYGTEDAQVFTDYKEHLKLDLDAVYVTTPNREHSFISIDAMKAGKNVLCEKPMAKTSAEAKSYAGYSKRDRQDFNHRLPEQIPCRLYIFEESM